MIYETDIRRIALELGFDDCAVAPAARLDQDALYMDNWVAAGRHGAMDYLERNREKRYDPRALVEGAQTVVVCLMTYAHTGRDYHRTMKSRLYALDARLREEYGEEVVSTTQQHIFCDSAPFLERRWAVLSGLGQIGRNHQLIHPTLGSMVHPGELVLQVPVEQDSTRLRPLREDICAGCTRCLDACPTGALRQEVWDATRCVAYTTHYCLACQIACPYNRNNSLNNS